MRRIVFLFLSGMMMLLFSACGDKARVYVGTASEEVEASEIQAGDGSGQTSDVVSEGTSETEGDMAAEKHDTIACYVCGAVKEPGVYYLSKDDRKQAAVEAAGGFAEDAVQSYVNLAEKVSDGEKIYIPTEAELEGGSYKPDSQQGKDETSDSGQVDINRADKERLMTLPGIGEAKADSIIAYRDEHGSFKSPEEILTVQGIKDGIYNRIKDRIVAY